MTFIWYILPSAAAPQPSSAWGHQENPKDPPGDSTESPLWSFYSAFMWTLDLTGGHITSPLTWGLSAGLLSFLLCVKSSKHSSPDGQPLYKNETHDQQILLSCWEGISHSFKGFSQVGQSHYQPPVAIVPQLRMLGRMREVRKEEKEQGTHNAPDLGSFDPTKQTPYW